MRRQLAIETQRNQLELGVIRIGEKRTSQTGKQYPASIEVFRFTSPHSSALEAVAKVYGGKVRPWEGSKGQYELYTEQNELRVLIKPDASISEAFEQWTGGGCTHRCDGVICEWSKKIVPEPKDAKSPRYEAPIEVPCMCDPDERDCKLMTRMRLLLSDVPLQGGWRFNTSSKIFSGQTGAAMDMLSAFGLGGRPVYGRLTLTIREVKKLHDAPKRFPVVEWTQDTDPPNYPALLAATMPGLTPANPVPSAPSLPEPVRALEGNEAVKAQVAALFDQHPHLKDAMRLEAFKAAAKDAGVFWCALLLSAVEGVGPDWDAIMREVRG